MASSRQRLDRPCLIGIAGPSCAGKGEIAKALALELRTTRPAILSLDSYYRDLAEIELRCRGERNFDVPEALDDELIFQHVAALARGESIAVPIYEFPVHARAPHTIPLAPGGLVIVEGLFTFYWETLRTHLEERIFVDAGDEICLARRLARDVRERGRTEESIRRQWECNVRPMYERHVLPTRAHATLIVDGEEPVAASAAAILAVLRPRLPG